ncbi:16S ribosomal RNA methyltransferase A [Natronorarus salvus]|uniref:16S ribosomal RNA methyltransferase A n=1 Tax=Natronorarus salvus TaxID=3117733 RepID=UPI002F26B6BC
MRDPDGLLARAGVRGDPNRDQHFLVDDRVLDRLPGYATEAGMETDHVLEVGAGTGALTDRLLAVSERVTAVERDPALVEFLGREFATGIDEGRLALLAGDALSVDFPEYTLSISNLPYGISSPILFRLLPRERPLVVMVQREFAERMVAEPGTEEYGRLSVSAGHYATCEIVETVPREAFSPQPAVESAVVRTTPRDPEYEVRDDAFFLRFVKALFTQRRKTLRNAIRNTAHISGLSDPERLVDATEADLLGRRPGELAPATFAALAERALEVEGA